MVSPTESTKAAVSHLCHQSVSFVAPPPRAHYTTVSTDGSAPLGQHKYCTEYSLARAAQFR